MEYSDYYQEALAEPMRWYRMDSDWMRDVKVRRLTRAGGWAYAGMYQALVACLAYADGHIYDLADDAGWEFLLADMNAGGCKTSVDDLREFVAMVVSVGLADKEMWAESRKLTSKRLVREAEENARRVADNKAGIDRMNKAKAAKAAARKSEK